MLSPQRSQRKTKVDIKNLVIALERPVSNEKISELNLVLGKYLDSVEEPLNMSFWETVIYDYWSFVNLTKLCDKVYDVREDEFVSKIRMLVRDRVNRDPTIPVQKVAPKYVAPTNVKAPPRDPSPKRVVKQPPYEELDDNVEVPEFPRKKLPWYKRWGNKIALALGLGVVFVGYKYYTRNE